MGMQRYDIARILPFLDNGSRSKVRMFYAQGCFMHKCVSGLFIGSSFLSIATGNYCTSIETLCDCALGLQLLLTFPSSFDT